MKTTSGQNGAALRGLVFARARRSSESDGMKANGQPETSTHEPAKVLAVVQSYDDLHAALRARQDQLDISCQTIDRAAALANGHSSKVLAPQRLKKAGWQTLGFLLPALGMKLALLEDAAAVEQLRKFPKREIKPAIRAVPTGRGRKRLVSKRFLRKIAPLGGKARMASMTAKQRSKHMRQVVLRRWHKPRVVEITKPRKKAARQAALL
jgi:hypothetical protein